MTTVILSLLAAIGLAALLWLLLGAMVLPTGHADSLRIYLLASGEGDGVEHTLRGLNWLCATGLLVAKVDIVDAGLNGAGRARIAYLLRDHPEIHLIRTERQREARTENGGTLPEERYGVGAPPQDVSSRQDTPSCPSSDQDSRQ